MNSWKSLAKNVGTGLLLLSSALIVPLVFSLSAGEPEAVGYAYLKTLLAMITVGSLFLVLAREEKLSSRKEVGYVSAVFITVISVALGALPYFFTGHLTMIDAIFESASGFTGTGMSLAGNIDTWENSLKLWRMLTQWYGGAAFMLYFIHVVFKYEDHLWKTESMVFSRFKLPKHITNANKSIFVFLMVYVIFTLVVSAVMALFGIDAFQAITHSMGLVSTGGFSNFSAGLGTLFVGKTIFLEYFILGVMALSGLSYFVHMRWIQGSHQEALKTGHIKSLVKLFGGALIAVLAIFELSGRTSPDMFKESFAIVASAVSTNGYLFVQGGISKLPTAIVMVVLAVAFVGGSMGSPASGFKIDRMRLLKRGYFSEIKRVSSPKQEVIRVKDSGEAVSSDLILRISLRFFSYITAIMVFVALVTIKTDFAFGDAVITIFGTVTNTGMSSGDIGSLPAASKGVLAVSMMVGRMEIIPFVLLLSKKIWRK